MSEAEQVECDLIAVLIKKRFLMARTLREKIAIQRVAEDLANNLPAVAKRFVGAKFLKDCGVV